MTEIGLKHASQKLKLNTSQFIQHNSYRDSLSKKENRLSWQNKSMNEQDLSSACRTPNQISFHKTINANQFYSTCLLMQSERHTDSDKKTQMINKNLETSVLSDGALNNAQILDNSISSEES